MRRIASLGLALLAAIALSIHARAGEGLPAQTSSQSGVTIKVTPRNLQAATWEFEVVFDTHSQELKDDLLKSALLVAAGVAPVAPAGWQGDPPGGHHRKGVLRFNAVSPAPPSLELRIARPGEAKPRSFRWELK